MYVIRNYVRPQTLEEAAELNRKRSTTLLAGGIWLHMGDKRIATAADLTGLGLEQIERTDDEYRIGAMASLRELEIHPELNKRFHHVFRDALEGIVGVQLRNAATVGGSVWGRFGFSDVVAVFLTLHADVELYSRGRVSLDEFIDHERRDRDILTAVVLKDRPVAAAFNSFRLEAADIPALNVGVSYEPDRGLRVVVGGRPGLARPIDDPDWHPVPEKTTDEAIAAYAKEAAAAFVYGSNLRGSAEYRQHLAAVLIKRLMKEVVRLSTEQAGDISTAEKEVAK